jgi:hypothetical protein
MAEGGDRDSKRPATERADELLTRVGWTIGLFASMAGRRVARVAAFAREEAEDMWAEAQDMRRHNGGESGVAAEREAETANVTATAQAVPQGQESDSERNVEPKGQTRDVRSDAVSHPLSSWMRSSGRPKDRGRATIRNRASRSRTGRAARSRRRG